MGMFQNLNVWLLPQLYQFLVPNPASKSEEQNKKEIEELKKKADNLQKILDMTRKTIDHDKKYFKMQNPDKHLFGEMM